MPPVLVPAAVKPIILPLYWYIEKQKSGPIPKLRRTPGGLYNGCLFAYHRKDATGLEAFFTEARPQKVRTENNRPGHVSPKMPQ
jgi:hypothetical protein